MINAIVNKLNRRRFMRKSLLVTGGVTAGFCFEHGPLLAKLKGASAPPETEITKGAVPTGRLGKLQISRLICGGNLFSGFAHSGDLLYVSGLLKHYFVPDKILDTLQICEERGINTTILRTDDHIIKVLRRYRKERGGKIQWIAQTYPKIDNLKDNVKLAIDNGAVGAFIMGGIGDDFHKKGRMDLIGEVIAFMKQNGVVAGVGSHLLDVPKAVEAQRIDPDFYFKTLNDVGYSSQKPAEIAAFMTNVKKPWIAFKVLGAGRVKPKEGFDIAFKMGADFVNVGMYDFQVEEDISLVREIVAGHAQRERGWHT